MRTALLILLIGLLALPSFCQIKDSSIAPQPRKRWVNNIFHDAVRSVSKNPNDTGEFLAPLVAKSEESYMQYQDKIIRNITVVQYNFERKLTDTANRMKTLATRVGNHLHTNTKEWVLRNHLFIKANVPLDPYKVADNERYLRTLPFIQDARILPAAVPGTDSVDLVIVAKDFFTLSGTAVTSGLSRIKARGYDANFLGMGQRLQVTLLHDVNRDPRWGYDIQFNRSSIGATFITGTVGISQIDGGRSDGREEEHAVFIRLERPLVSPNARLVGGLELSYNGSLNTSHRPDSLFYSYAYNVADAWVGYNINTDNSLLFNNVIRDRKVIALRYLNQQWNKLPSQVGDRFDPIYNNKQAVLAAMTFFRLDYYKTQYIYGFGLTEDLPYGYNTTVTTGWYRQNNADRAYLGIDANRYLATAHGKFCQWYIRGGAFLRKGKFEDVGILAGSTVFSRVYEAGRTKMRQQVSANAAAIINRTGLEALRVDNPLGLRDFRTDSILAANRISVGTESVVFLPCKPFGFRLAPFAFCNAVFLTPYQEQQFQKMDGFVGIGGGLRARNDNLIFGTNELKFTYFPRTAFGVKQFQVNLVSNLRYRYRNDYVRIPDVYRLNTDGL